MDRATSRASYLSLIRSQFPEFRLEDKPLSEEGGNVTAQPQEAIGLKDVIAQKEKQEPKEWKVYRRGQWRKKGNVELE